MGDSLNKETNLSHFGKISNSRIKRLTANAFLILCVGTIMYVQIMSKVKKMFMEIVIVQLVLWLSG